MMCFSVRIKDSSKNKNADDFYRLRFLILKRGLVV